MELTSKTLEKIKIRCINDAEFREKLFAYILETDLEYTPKNIPLSELLEDLKKLLILLDVGY